MSIPKMFEPTGNYRISLYFVEEKDFKNILKKIAVLNTKSHTMLYSNQKMAFSNFSCRFLNPNNFFQFEFEFEFFSFIRSNKPPGIS